MSGPPAVCLSEHGTTSTTRRLLPLAQETDAPAGAGGLRQQGYGKRSEPDRPLISVVTVVRNGAAHLAAGIRSVLAQSYDNIEYIIVDGASDDGTLDIIRRYDAHIDVWISEPDENLYEAMNKGVDLARGDWIYFLGADDRLVDSLHRVAAFLRDRRTLYYGDVYMPARHRLYDGRFSMWKLAWTNVCHQAIFTPRHVYERYRFNTRYSIQADWELLMRCRADADLRLQYVPMLVAVFDDQAGLSSNRADDAFNTDYLDMVRRYFPAWIYLCRAAAAAVGKLLRRLGFM